MYNKLYIYFYDLYSPVASFFLCVCVCGYVVRAFVERELRRFHFNLLIFGVTARAGGGGGVMGCWYTECQ